MPYDGYVWVGEEGKVVGTNKEEKREATAFLVTLLVLVDSFFLFKNTDINDCVDGENPCSNCSYSENGKGKFFCADCQPLALDIVEFLSSKPPDIERILKETKLFVPLLKEGKRLADLVKSHSDCKRVSFDIACLYLTGRKNDIKLEAYKRKNKVGTDYPAERYCHDDD